MAWRVKTTQAKPHLATAVAATGLTANCLLVVAIARPLFTKSPASMALVVHLLHCQMQTLWKRAQSGQRKVASSSRNLSTEKEH